MTFSLKNTFANNCVTAVVHVHTRNINIIHLRVGYISQLSAYHTVVPVSI